MFSCVILLESIPRSALPPSPPHSTRFLVSRSLSTKPKKQVTGNGIELDPYIYYIYILLIHNIYTYPRRESARTSPRMRFTDTPRLDARARYGAVVGVGDLSLQLSGLKTQDSRTLDRALAGGYIHIHMYTVYTDVYASYVI